VKTDRLRPGVGASFPIWAPLVDVDDLVEQWRALREAARAAKEATVVTPNGGPEARYRQGSSWLGRLLRRRSGR
jgi:hypothetical protein